MHDPFDPLPGVTLFHHIKNTAKHHLEEHPGYVRTYILSDRDVPTATQERLGRHIRSLDEIPESEIGTTLFYICFTFDSDALLSLKKIKQHGGRFVPHLEGRKTSYRFVNRLASQALHKTWAQGERVSHLEFDIHENICEAIEFTAGVEGDYVEIGVYKGGSALTALNYMAEKLRAEAWTPRQTWLLDTFDGMVYPEMQQSIDPVWNQTHRLFGVEKTKAYLKQTLDSAGLPYHLVENNICADALPAAIGKIAVANVDVDVYEATVAALNKVAPHITPGGVILAEDAASTPFLYGAYLALHEFMESDAGKAFHLLFKKGQYFLIRK